MKQMTVFCDSCRKMIPDKPHQIDDMDFCSACWPKVVQAIRELTTGSKRKPREQIDTGKAQALRNAGWPVSKIAEELGCSVSVVYRATSTPPTPPAVKEHEWEGGKA